METNWLTILKNHLIGIKGAGWTDENLTTIDALIDTLGTLIGTIDAATTDSLHGKLGTDTELADYSFYDLLGGNAFKTNALSAMLGAFTTAQNLKAILGNLTTTKNLGGILGAFTTANNLKALLGALTTTDTLKAILGGYTAAASLKDALDTIAGYLTTEIADILAAVDTEVADIKTETDQLPNVQHETEWSSTPTIEALANAAATALNVGSITPTYPAGATRVRAILIATIHVANKTAVAHHIKFRIEGQKAAGGYGDLLDLRAQEGLSMVDVDGATDGWSGAIDVTALVNASGEAYDFRFEVDSDNAGNVIYICSFVLTLVYTM